MGRSRRCFKPLPISLHQIMTQKNPSYSATIAGVMLGMALIVTTAGGDQALALIPSIPEISEGRYAMGGTDQGLQVQGSQYRYYDEGGEKPWRPLSELASVHPGVVFDGNYHWCLSTMAREPGAIVCAQNGWRVPTVNPKQDVPSASRTLRFACTADNGKEIRLYETATTIDYAFGHPNATPELDLRVPRDQASTHQWQGIGRWMNYAVDVPNGDTTYSVFWGVDRISDRHEVEAGVRVQIKGENAATVNCNKVTANRLEGIMLKPTQP
jgi:hypothetical protein